MTHRLARQGLVVGSCLLAFLASACTPGDPPAPPTTSSPPVTSPTPTENAQEREQRLAYEAAETSYREFRAEYNRLTAAGGADKVSPKLQNTSGGAYQRELLATLRAFKKAGYRTKGDEVIPPIRRAGYSSSSLLIDACEDDRGVKTYDRSGKRIDDGDILIVHLEVRKSGTAWKVWSGSGSEASTCDDF
jgi:hypothetical protein